MNATDSNERTVLFNRIKDMVSVEHERVDHVYQQIGREYVKLHAEDFEEPFGVYMQQMAEIRSALDALSLQKQLILGNETCPECGNRLPPDSVYCNKCGIKLPDLPYDNYDKCRCGAYVEKDKDVCPICGESKHKVESNWIECPNCHTFVDNKNKFCPNCAHPLIEEVPKTKRCPNCKSEMPIDLNFCTKCGHRF